MMYYLGKFVFEALTTGAKFGIHKSDPPAPLDPANNLQIQTRSQLPLLLNELGLNGEGVEIGTGIGSYAVELLRSSKLRILYCVDPWVEYIGPEYNVSIDRQNYCYFLTVMRLLEFTTRSVILRMFSKTAEKLFNVGSLDFVYLDANLSYESCKEDISLWWPKVKTKGILAGHDYLDTDASGVKQAVDEFSEKYKQKLYTTNARIGPDSNMPSWYIIKA